MATCVTLTKGRKLPCKNSLGGIKAIGLIPYAEGLLVDNAGEIATIPVGVTSIYRYELKSNTNKYDEEMVSDSESRTVVYNGTLTAVLQKLDLETKNELKLIAYGEVIVFVETYAGDIFCIGTQNGTELTGSAVTTGGAKTDMSGTTLTFKSVESIPYSQLSSAAKITYATKIV